MRFFIQKLLVTSLLTVGVSITAYGQTKTTEKAESGFAVVELFTSEGCSSCPSADENLAVITRNAESKGQKVVTLSFHVDYWNNLGWKDPYSSAEATKRQRLYSGVHGTSQVYTPQMVVNGTTEFVGSQRAKSTSAIQSVLKTKPTASLDLKSELSNNKVLVNWKASGAQNTDLVNIALVQKSAMEKVPAGENGGSTLKHVNVVRQFRVLSVGDSEQTVSLDVPVGFKSSDFHIVGYVQSPNDASIQAATVSNIGG